MGDNIPRDDTAETVLRDMAGILWRLLDGGYVNSNEPDEDETYSRCEYLRNMAHQDVARARAVLGIGDGAAPLPLSAQIADARRAVASWPDARRGNVQLEGSGPA